MGQNGQGPSLFSADLSKKRKRGRPRKDEHLVQQNSMPAAPARGVGPMNYGHTAMLGQVVNGYIDGMFDGGYLITVKIGDTYLRGLAFLPGRVVPITSQNDVAPHAKIIRRHEISTPGLDQQAKHGTSVSHSENNNEQFGCIPLLDSQSKHTSSTLPSEESSQLPGIPASITLDQVTPARPLSAVTIAMGNQSAAFRIPSTDNFHKCDTGSSLEKLFFSENTPGSKLENRTPALSLLRLENFCEQNKAPHDFGALNVMERAKVSTELTEPSKIAIGLECSIEPTLNLVQQSQSASCIAQLKHENLAVHDKVLQNSGSPAVVKGANMSLGLNGIFGQGALAPCADFLGKFPKNGSALNYEAGVCELEVDESTSGEVANPDLQLKKASIHAELEKPSDIPSEFGPIAGINVPSENITEERPSDPSVDVCEDRTMPPGRNLPNDVAEFKQATSNPTCMQAIPAESELLAEGSIFTEASKKKMNSSALKPDLLSMTSDMGTIPSEPTIAVEASCLSNAIETSAVGSSSATK